MTRLQVLSATFGCRPATRHLVIVAALNPPADVLGLAGALAWSAAVERLHKVRKLEAALNFPHRPLYQGGDPGAPDRAILFCDG